MWNWNLGWSYVNVLWWSLKVDAIRFLSRVEVKVCVKYIIRVNNVLHYRCSIFIMSLLRAQCVYVSATKCFQETRDFFFFFCFSPPLIAKRDRDLLRMRIYYLFFFSSYRPWREDTKRDSRRLKRELWIYGQYFPFFFFFFNKRFSFHLKITFY